MSVLVETPDCRLLLDTGMGETLLRNAAALKIGLDDLDGVVLSHGHLDHTGGLGPLLAATGRQQVFCHPAVFQKKITKSHGAARDISLPWHADKLRQRGATVVPVTEPIWPTPKLVISGPIPMTTDFETVDANLFIETEAGQTPDLMEDELAVGVVTDKGLIVVLGCAHRGPINAIRYLMTLSGCDKLRAVVGGIHLSRADDTRIERNLAAFRELNPELLACCHCTGPKAEAALQAAFNDTFVFVTAGTRWVFD